MRISDWSSDVCSSDLFRHDRQEDQNLCNTPCAPATAGQGRRLGRLCQPRLQGAASRERQVAERIDREVLVAGGGMVGLALAVAMAKAGLEVTRSEEHTSELQSLMRISYAVFCLKKTNITTN